MATNLDLTQSESLVVTQAHRLLRRKQVEQALGMSRSNIYSKMDKNSPHYDPTFPLPVKIGDRAIAWVVAEVESWIASRIAARG